MCRDGVEIGCVDWIEDTELDNVSMQMKVDIGAQANILPFAMFKKYFEGNKLLSKSHVKVTGYGGSNIPVMGEVSFSCKINDIVSEIQVHNCTS